jgi:hypothetical protein
MHSAISESSSALPKPCNISYKRYNEYKKWHRGRNYESDIHFNLIKTHMLNSNWEGASLFANLLVLIYSHDMYWSQNISVLSWITRATHTLQIDKYKRQKNNQNIRTITFFRRKNW